ncbi:hypothetical protein DL89DRAFT_15128 [Linderina pennispora]|uniref:Uncharacterized protein n=1 Tax=Linderina pennispora TaxID=61395 RepID=A0A1Y1WLC8_9FUNG|nr:uncharacterized protein DL89DRAFT_15128 [Linderina pennispora]ORX74370.1 hypothetical protein DL89DRAFT_15128 [Linderina pennispora]
MAPRTMPHSLPSIFRCHDSWSIWGKHEQRFAPLCCSCSTHSAVLMTASLAASMSQPYHLLSELKMYTVAIVYSRTGYAWKSSWSLILFLGPNVRGDPYRGVDGI